MPYTLIIFLLFTLSVTLPARAQDYLLPEYDGSGKIEGFRPSTLVVSDKKLAQALMAQQMNLKTLKKDEEYGDVQIGDYVVLMDPDEKAQLSGTSPLWRAQVREVADVGAARLTFLENIEKNKTELFYPIYSSPYFFNQGRSLAVFTYVDALEKNISLNIDFPTNEQHRQVQCRPTVGRPVWFESTHFKIFTKNSFRFSPQMPIDINVNISEYVSDLGTYTHSFVFPSTVLRILTPRQLQIIDLSIEHTRFEFVEILNLLFKAGGIKLKCRT